MKKTVFQKALENIQNSCGWVFSIREYSGRGMNGRNCLAIVTDNHVDLLGLGMAMADHLTKMNEDFSYHDLGTNTDSMDLGQVIYWPSIQYVQDEESEE